MKLLIKVDRKAIKGFNSSRISKEFQDLNPTYLMS
jgi:hypothetical protein